MKTNPLLNILVMAVTPLMAVVSSCKDADLWDELPTEISEFISQYYPNSGIDSFTDSSTTYHVRLSNGPGITFDKNYHWEAINGYGMPLPQVLLFDQLPPALYQYIEETEELNEVFSIERNSKSYTIVLLDSTLHYYIETQAITGSDSSRA